MLGCKPLGHQRFRHQQGNAPFLPSQAVSLHPRQPPHVTDHQLAEGIKTQYAFGVADRLGQRERDARRLAGRRRRLGPRNRDVAHAGGNQLQARIQRHRHLLERLVKDLNSPLGRNFHAAQREIVRARFPQQGQLRAMGGQAGRQDPQAEPAAAAQLDVPAVRRGTGRLAPHQQSAIDGGRQVLGQFEPQLAGRRGESRSRNPTRWPHSDGRLRTNRNAIDRCGPPWRPFGRRCRRPRRRPPTFGPRSRPPGLRPRPSPAGSSRAASPRRPSSPVPRPCCTVPAATAPVPCRPTGRRAPPGPSNGRPPTWLRSGPR